MAANNLIVFLSCVSRNLRMAGLPRLLSILLEVCVITGLAFSTVIPSQSAYAAGITVDRTDDNAGASACTGAANDCSLRGATLYANANPGTTINVPAGTYQLTIDGASEGGLCYDATIGDLDIAGNNTSIVGAGAATTIIQQTRPSDRVICVDQNLAGNFNFSISGVTITGGRDTFGVCGGGMVSGYPGDVTTVTNVVFSNNLTSGGSTPWGGGLCNGAGALTVTGSTFTGNSATGQGGGLYYSNNGTPDTNTLSLDTSTFSNNVSGANGGGILVTNTNSAYTVTRNTFTGNTASGSNNGNAIYNASGTLNASYNRFVNPAAGNDVYGSTGATNITNNWWGCNGGPGATGCDTAGGSGVSSNPWIILKTTVIPNPLAFGGAATLTTSVLQNSSGGALTAANVAALVGLPVTWTNAVGGSFSGSQAVIQSNGEAISTFTHDGLGCSNASAEAKIDNVQNGDTDATVSITITCPPEMDLKQGATAIADGGSYAFGSQTLGSNTDVVFTIENSGAANLTLTTPISIGGADAGQFSIQAQLTSPVAASGNTTFTVRFTPTSTGAKTATISITNNDSNENPYDLTITGMGTAPEMDLRQGVTAIADGGSHDFGSQLLSSNTDVVFTIENSGTGNLTFTTPITIGGADAGQFSIQAQPTSPVAASGNTTFTVRFTPTSTGAKTATISIANSDSNENPYDLTITGTGTAPEMDLRQGVTAIADGGSHDFGSQLLSSNTDVVFTIENSGTGNLTFTTPISIGGADAGQFSIQTQPSSPVTVSGTTTFTVRFTPTSIGLKTATISIANNDGNENPYDLTITGTGTAPEIDLRQGVTAIADGGSHDFGSQLLSSNTDVVFTIENSGNINLTLTTPITIGGADAGQFSIQAQPTSPVAGSGSTTFSVRFTPTSAGAKTATISIANNDSNENPYDLTITGTGTAPEMDLRQGVTAIADGGSHNFGSHLLTTDTDVVFTIENSGNINLTFTTPISIGGADAGQFSIQAQPTSPVAASGSTTFTVRFTPTSTGAKTATISIANSDSNENPYDLTITGTGTAPEMDLRQGVTAIADGSSHDFGSHALSTNTDVVFTIENSGTGNLTITTPISIGGADAGQFSIQAQPTSPVAASGSTTYTVRFTPTSTGLKTATISIANNDSNENPYDLTITGTGTAPEMDLRQGVTAIADGGSHDFGSVAVGSTSDVVFTIENSGTANLTVNTSLATGGANADQFSIQAQPSSPVGASGTTTFTVRFTPTSGGAKTATISITNDDSDENPYDLTITGTGTAPGINLVKTTNGTDNNVVTGPVVAVGSTVTWTYTVTNTGNVPLKTVTVVDDHSPAVVPVYQSGDTNSNGLLDLTETWIYTAIGVAVAGQYTNTGTASGTDNTNTVVTPVTDTDPDHYWGVQPGINLVKTTNGTDNNVVTGPVVAVGSTVTWMYTVTNTGNVPLKTVTVVDDHSPVPVYLGSDTNSNGLLDLTETWIYTAIGVAVAGQYTNTGTASGTDNTNTVVTPVTDTDPDHYFGGAPEMDLKRGVTATADGGSHDFGSVAVGSTSDVVFTIENSGTANLTVNTSLATGGANADQFSIQAQPSSPVGASGTTTFTVRFTPTSIGAKTATISIANNDSNENPYDLTITGTGTQGTPVITWNNPASIVTGTALSGAQLNATANVAGAFVYTPAAGVILPVGTHILHVDFTPTDAVNYTNASRDVNITVTGGGGGGGGGSLVPTIIASDGTYLDKVNVTWTPVSGASYYLVYRSESLGGIKIPTSGYRATSLGGDDVWTSPGVTYYYWVRACDAISCGDFSASDTGWQGLPAPVITASDGAFPDKVQVTFPAVNWATSYLAYRSLSQDGVKIPTNGYFTIAPGGDDIWAAPGVTYYYWVKACNGPNCSALSAYDTGWR